MQIKMQSTLTRQGGRFQSKAFILQGHQGLLFGKGRKEISLMFSTIRLVGSSSIIRHDGNVKDVDGVCHDPCGRRQGVKPRKGDVGKDLVRRSSVVRHGRTQGVDGTKVLIHGLVE